MDGFIGEVKYFAGTYPPMNWAFCEGQQLPIVQYTPLYSLIGTIYGGDGKTYFNLPDFRGRMPLGVGQGSGTSYRHQGEIGGNESIKLTQLNTPAHNHNVNCDTSSPPPAYKNTPVNNFFASKSQGTNYAPGGTGATSLMNQNMVAPAGQDVAHENMPPWLCTHMIICLYGYYPIRP